MAKRNSTAAPADTLISWRIEASPVSSSCWCSIALQKSRTNIPRGAMQKLGDGTTDAATSEDPVIDEISRGFQPIDYGGVQPVKTGA